MLKPNDCQTWIRIVFVTCHNIKQDCTAARVQMAYTGLQTLL